MCFEVRKANREGVQGKWVQRELSADRKSEMTKALVMFSYGRVGYTKASEIAAKAAPIFDEESKKNEVLAHKGVNWYAKELLKVV